MKVSRREAFETMTDDQDKKKRILYDQLLAATINQLKGYVAGGGDDALDDLKIRCRQSLSKLTEKKRKEIDTVQKLLLFMDKQGAIGPDDVWLIKTLAEKLDLPELVKEVKKYEAESFSGNFTRSSIADILLRESIKQPENISDIP